MIYTLLRQVLIRKCKNHAKCVPFFLERVQFPDCHHLCSLGRHCLVQVELTDQIHRLSLKTFT